jgi:3-oxoacyl-[acyl-carrier protein] reductase
MVSLDNSSVRNQLTSRRAFVTGGATGIGAAIAAQLAKSGADVAIDYLDRPDAAEALTKSIRQEGVRSMFLRADVSDPRAAREAFDQLDEEWGGVDILINNAGIDG